MDPGSNSFSVSCFCSSFLCKRSEGLASHLACFSLFCAKVFDSVSLLITIFVSPSSTMATEREKRRCLQFPGEEDDFAYWSEKFEGYMHTKKLRGQLLRTEASNNDEKYYNWAELLQCLDKRSNMMLKSECKGDGPEAWKRLAAHVSSSEAPR